MAGEKPVLPILTHWSDSFHTRRYLLKLLIPEWEALGYRVEVVSDRSVPVPGEVAFLHTDLSIVPESLKALARQYRTVVNGRVTDIRKRRFSRLLVGRADDYRGPVIVKTDCNSGGGQDWRLGITESRVGRIFGPLLAQKFWLKILARLEMARPWRSRRLLGFSRYPVFENSRWVPPGVWDNPHLIVERFLPEREGKNYCCRHWLFLGSKEVTRRTVSLEPIVKVGDRIEPTDDKVPEELRAVRARLGLDYAKFDYGVVDGQVVLYDVNPTPGASADPAAHENTVAVLSEGLATFRERSVVYSG